MALPSPLFLALALLGTAYGHWFSTIILISLVDVWKSRANTYAAWQMNTWAMSGACQGHAACTLHALCYLIGAVQCSLDLPETQRTNEKFMCGSSGASLLYEPKHHGVNPSWWAQYNRRASGCLFPLWPSVSFTFPTGWISCSCGAWHGVSQTQTWEPRHMLGGRVTGLWLWISPIWSTAVSVLEQGDLNFTQYSSDVCPAHPLLLEIPCVFLNCTCLP